MIKTPLTAFELCILIPCYNNSAGLRASLMSIDYLPSSTVVVVVDDGSTVPVNSGLANDCLFAVDIVRLHINQGITAALNEGLAHIRACYDVRFIARLDCGDICHPERFYRQIVFLQQHPDVLLLGSWCRFVDPESGNGHNYITPLRHDELVKEMHWRNCFIHPTVMWRNDARIPATYPVDFPAAEDYAFFFEIMQRGKTAIVNEFLVTCEINASGISLRHRHRQLESRLAVVQHYNERGWRSKLGVWKLRLLMLIPYSLIGRLKSARSFIKHYPTPCAAGAAQ